MLAWRRNCLGFGKEFFNRIGQEPPFDYFCSKARNRTFTVREHGIGAALYLRFTAMAVISIRKLFTKPAAWIVVRAGFGSGITAL